MVKPEFEVAENSEHEFMMEWKRLFKIDREGRNVLAFFQVALLLGYGMILIGFYQDYSRHKGMDRWNECVCKSIIATLLTIIFFLGLNLARTMKHTGYSDFKRYHDETLTWANTNFTPVDRQMQIRNRYDEYMKQYNYRKNTPLDQQELDKEFKKMVAAQ